MLPSALISSLGVFVSIFSDIELADDTSARCPLLGMKIDHVVHNAPLRPEYKQLKLPGVRVISTVPLGPADKAGVKSEDLIVNFAGQVIREPKFLTFIAKSLVPGDKLEIFVVRDTKVIALAIEVGVKEGKLKDDPEVVQSPCR